MSEIKVRLSIEVPGANMMSSQLCEENNNFKTEKLTVKTYDKKKKRELPHTLVIKTRGSVPAKQSISISKEAYLYMTSLQGNTFGTTVKTKEWQNMSKKARLNLHMKAIAEDLGGKDAKYHFDILDD